ncbi:MAG: hypothetical protein Q4P34_07615 [Tissierellia bacterium]|nr:hypothetical protein [Tissierellia bacterium]
MKNLKNLIYANFLILYKSSKFIWLFIPILTFAITAGFKSFIKSTSFLTILFIQLLNSRNIEKNDRLLIFSLPLRLKEYYLTVFIMDFIGIFLGLVFSILGIFAIKFIGIKVPINPYDFIVIAFYIFIIIIIKNILSVFLKTKFQIIFYSVSYGFLGAIAGAEITTGGSTFIFDKIFILPIIILSIMSYFIYLVKKPEI